MGRKSRADIRRPEILEHTYQTLLDESLESASLVKIARRAGIAPSLISHYFDSKDELIAALADYLTDKYDVFLMRDFQAIRNPEERLEAILEARFGEWSKQAVEDRVWFDIYALSLRHPRIHNKLKEMYRKDREALMSQLESCAVREVSSGDLETLAVIITMCMEGIGYFTSLMEPEYPFSKTVEIYRKILLEESKKILL